MLIFSKNKEGKAPKSVYANSRINQFFGCNVVPKTSSKRKVPNPYVRDRVQKNWESCPLKRKIFRDMEVYIDRDEFSDLTRAASGSLGRQKSSDRPVSLLEIVMEHQLKHD